MKCPYHCRDGKRKKRRRERRQRRKRRKRRRIRKTKSRRTRKTRKTRKTRNIISNHLFFVIVSNNQILPEKYIEIDEGCNQRNECT